MIEFFDNEESYDIDEEEEENPSRNMNIRRKNEWKFATRRKAILKNHITKPLHYYSKNMPESHVIDKRQIRKSEQQLDDFKSQLNDIYSEE